MFKKILTVTLLSLFVLAFYYSGKTSAATVGATVTAQNVSISITNDTVAYGFLPLDTSRATTGGVSPIGTKPLIQNTGNVNIDLKVTGTSSASWTLSSTNTAPNTYIHKFCSADTSCDPASNYTALTLAQQDLALGLAPSATQTLDLEITTPQDTAIFTAQTVNVTVLATAAN